MIGYNELPQRARAARASLRTNIERAAVREILMGAQDNLTNVLAVVLGVTIGSGRADFIALAGLSAGIAEAISMGGVLYNSTRAEERMRGDSDRRGLAPVMSGVVTFAAALVAGLVPLLPFAFLAVQPAVIVSLAASTVGLFLLGSMTGRMAGASWLSEGIRLVLVAGLAALAAAVIGATLHVA
jgi:VIT1/CCC1 family predicted Fe2+/Mn2+ transporter